MDPHLALYRFYGTTTYDEDDEEELGSFIRDEVFKIGGRGGYGEGDEPQVIADDDRGERRKKKKPGSLNLGAVWSGSRMIIDVGPV